MENNAGFSQDWLEQSFRNLSDEEKGVVRNLKFSKPGTKVNSGKKTLLFVTLVAFLPDEFFENENKWSD